MKTVLWMLCGQKRLCSSLALTDAGSLHGCHDLSVNRSDFGAKPQSSRGFSINQPTIISSFRHAHSIEIDAYVELIASAENWVQQTISFSSLSRPPPHPHISPITTTWDCRRCSSSMFAVNKENKRGYITHPGSVYKFISFTTQPQMGAWKCSVK